MAEIILETDSGAQTKVDAHNVSGTAHADIRALVSATPDATGSVKGKIQITGDLGGTAASPTVPGLAAKADASALTAHTSSTSNPHSVTAAQVGLGNASNTSDATKNAATATLTNKTLTSPVINSPTGIVKADVGLGNVDNTSNATERATARTLTNARITKRVGTTASSATPTPDSDGNDLYTVTALAANATFGAPTGTPTDGQSLLIRIKDNGTARTLAWNAAYRALGVTLPTTTVLSKTLYVGAKWNAADSVWDVIATAQQA